MPFTINIGTEVQLNVGGPEMSVQDIDGDAITCVWFDRDGKVRERVFLRSMLKDPHDKLWELLAKLRSGEDPAGSRADRQ